MKLLQFIRINFLIITFFLNSFLVYAQEVVGTWSLSGFVCKSSGNFHLVRIPEQLVIDASWTLNSDGTMSLTANMERAGRTCSMSANGSYTFKGSTLNYTVRNSDGECAAPEGVEDTIEGVQFEGNFLYIPLPSNLEGGKEACHSGDVFQAFVKQ